MGFDFDAFEKEKKALPLHKQQGTTFSPSEKDTQTNRSMATDRRSKQKKSTSSSRPPKAIKTPKVKLTQKEKKSVEKKETFDKFKNSLNLTSIDLVSGFMDKAIQALEDALDVAKDQKAKAIELLKNKHV